MNNYRKRAALFLTSQGITLFGSSLVQFAMIWYVTMQTSSGVWVSAMTVAAYLPQFLISFLSGVGGQIFPQKTNYPIGCPDRRSHAFACGSLPADSRRHAGTAVLRCDLGNPLCRDGNPDPRCECGNSLAGAGR